MSEFDAELSLRLARLREQGLYRELRRVDSPQTPHITADGKTLLNFSSNDYLGLANDAHLKAAANEAIERFGAGAGASRLICGSLAPHHLLEEILAAFKGAEAALSFSSGYAAALGTIGALAGSNDIVILDKLVHASLVDAARLSGARLRVFAHNDLNRLEDHLKWATGVAARHDGTSKCRVLVVTESVFSMDGDHAPLAELVELKDRYGAWLMLDEAHATGLYGKNRQGLAEEAGVCGRIEIQMGTLGKALGAAGGFICGSRLLIDYLVNRARAFIFSTAPVPAAAAAACAGVRFVQSAAGEQRRRQLWERVAQLRPPSNTASSDRSAILPILVGDEGAAVSAAAALREKGLLIPAIRFPTVARGRARLRLTVTAAHTFEDLERVRAALQQADLEIRPQWSPAPVNAHAPAG